ncbi:TPA: hypothetical protein ACH3X1_013864 [Trebouxia sp. C0004]
MHPAVTMHTPACRLTRSLPAHISSGVHARCSRRCRQAFRCRAKRPETSTAEQPKKAELTEQQADDKVTDIKDNAEAAGEGVDIEKQGSEIRVTKQSGEQIYIGFDKGDKDRSKPGRVISDDPSRYPDRTQTTGGWSGGEKGLAAFIEEEQQKLSANKAVVPEDQREAQKAGNKPTVVSKDGDTIYLGFDKGDTRKPGQAGRYIQDDPKKYPGKENMGPLSGVVGGFAGGEAGLQQFIQEGEIKFKDPNEKGSGSFNILAFAGLFAVATTVGGVLLTDAVDFGEVGVKEGVSNANAQLQQLTSSPSGGDSKILLEVVLALFGVTATGVVIRTALKSVAGKVTRSSLNVAKLAIFWTGVFIAARFILESN